MTKIAVREGRLYLTDYAAKVLRVSDMTDAEGLAEVWTRLDDQAP